MGNNVNWTPEQENAITYRGGAAIISAAAGSGKTAVLVERVKRLLLDTDDPVKADELVISTFTQKAAGEMKARLERTLDEELAADPENRYLAEQRIRLNDASISTISSFCLTLLRRYSALLGEQPDLGVLDESEAGLIYAHSLAQVIEDFCENGNEDDRKLLYDWFAGEDDKKIEEAVSYLYRFSRNIPDADAFFSAQTGMYRDPDSSAGKMLDGYFRKNITEQADNLNEMCGQLTAASAGTPAEAFAAQWQGIADLWHGLGDMYDAAAVAEAYAADKETGSPALPRKTKDFDNSVIKDLNSELKEIRAGLSRAAGLLSRRTDNMRTCAPVLEILVSLVKKLDEIYSAEKRSRGRVDFADIELMTLKMLRNADGTPSDAARTISAGISEIIVDEFQDSNEIQYEIFRLISREKKNLYFVGDIKQSIYRFRGADPLVFARLTKDPDFNVITLNRNFRSSPEVIDSVNGIFTGTMTEELGDVRYDDSCALVRGAAYEPHAKNRTELITFTTPKTETSRTAEAAYIADRIKRMVREGFPVGAGDSKRPCRYGDFAVLMGKYSANIPIYKAALERAGIPFDAKEDGGYTDFSEIKHALALLRTIDDPYRDSDLAAVLMKEPYLLSADEMAQIKLAGGDRKHKNLWTGLVEYAKTDSRAADILREINEYREFAAENSAERLIRKICDESMLIPAAEASPDGIKRGANLRMLIHYAHTFSGGESSGLCDFISYMENIDREKIRLTQAKGGGITDNAVRLMTIHGSKGLEFPICFVANLSSRKNTQNGGSIICDPAYGIGMKINDSRRLLTIDTLPYDMVAAESTRLDMSEEMRLLYVAATRAKEKLIFTAPVTPRTVPDMHYGWIIESSAVRKGLIEVTPLSGYAPEDAEKEQIADAANVELRPFEPYSHIAFSRIPAKVTATQIGVKSVDDFAEYGDKIDRFLRVPTFLGDRSASKLTGKKRGDAYHKVMELLDFSCDPADVGSVLDDLLARGKLTEAERISVEEADIAGFLNSGLCRRAAVSGDINREFPIFCEYTPPEDVSGISDWTDEGKPFIQGIADMFFVEDGEIVLVDYKTNRGVTPAQLAEEYSGQLDIYARALSEATGMKVKEKILYSFSLGEVRLNS